MKEIKVIFIISVFTLITSGFLTLNAQETGEEVYDLSPFEISDDAIRGYATTSSLAASRVAIPITDLAASVITINKNLIEDLVASDIRDTFNMVAGVHHGSSGSGNQTSNQVSMRGYKLTGGQRDGLPDLLFTSPGGFDYNMVERIELIKGPSGATYGIHNPGGIINVISKKPLPVPATTINGLFGSYSTWQTSIDHSVVLGDEGKTGFRVAATFKDSDGVGGHTQEPGGSFMINPSISHQFDNGWKAWAWAMKMDDNSNRRMPMAYGFGFNNFASIGQVGILKNVVPEYSNLWANLSFVDIESFEGGLEKSFQGDTFDGDFRFVVRKSERDSDASRIRGIGKRNYIGEGGVVLTTESRSYNFGDGELKRITRDSSRFDDRLSTSELEVIAADLNLEFGDRNSFWGEHNLLTYVQHTGTAGWSENDSWDVKHTTLDQSVLDANGWDEGRIEMWPVLNSSAITPEWIQSNYTKRTIRGTTDQSGGGTAWGALDRTYWADGKIITSLGIRKDEVDNKSTRVKDGSPDVITDTEDSDTSGNFSILGKAVETEKGSLSLFFNNSDTFIPVRTIDERLATFGKKFPNRTVSTDEFGVKLDLDDSRIVATLSVFDNVESDVLRTLNDDLAGTITGIPAPDGNILGESYSAPVGARETKGWDIDLFLNPIEPLNIIFSYGDLETAMDSGLRDDAIPSSTMSFLAKYSFMDGPLNGFDVTYQISKWGRFKLADNFGVKGGVENFVDGDDVENLVLGYKNGNWSYRLRVDNIQDDVQLLPGRFWTAMGAIYERSYRFSVTYRK